jgi:hypothetical protein
MCDCACMYHSLLINALAVAQALGAVIEKTPELMGGSADLTGNVWGGVRVCVRRW